MPSSASKLRHELPSDLKMKRAALFANGRTPSKEEWHHHYVEIRNNPKCGWYTLKKHSNYYTNKLRELEKENTTAAHIQRSTEQATTPSCVAPVTHISSLTLARCLQTPGINQSVVNIILVAIVEQVDAKHLFSALCDHITQEASQASGAPHPAVDPLPDPDGALYSSGESSGSQTGTLTDYGDFEYGMDDAGMGLDTAIGMDEVGMGMYDSFGMGA